MRPLSNVRPPGRGVRGVLPPALLSGVGGFEGSEGVRTSSSSVAA